MPERIQLKRTKGWRMPENTVKVDRTTRWGNPFPVEWFDGDAARAVEAFRAFVNPGSPLAVSIPLNLRGKNLACWCALDAPCHADVLLELANA
jgi:hypothetical protein